MSQKSLLEVQSWIQKKILDRAQVSTEESDLYLKETKTFTHEMRWDIYQYAIWERLIDAIELDFKVTSKLFGKVELRNLIALYLSQTPSNHPSLAHVGLRLANFIKHSKWNDSHPWLAELIEFECSMICMEYCEGAAAPIAPEKLALLDVISPDKLHFKIDPTMMFISSVYPVHSIFEQETLLPVERSYNVIFARDFDPYYETLDQIQFLILKEAKGGATLFDILEQFNLHNYPSEKIFEVFQAWMSKQWIQDITITN